MTLRRITTLGLLATALLISSACDLGEKSIGNETGADQGDGDGDGDGDSGDGDGDGDTGDTEGSCGAETLTTVTDLGAALPDFDGVASEYIAMAEGEYLGSFDWLPNDGPVMVAHAGTSSPLTVGLAYEAGEIRLTEVERVGQFPDDGLDGGWLCSNELEIDAWLTFATEDGLFAEAMPVTLRVYSQNEETQAPGFSFSLDMDALQGDLALSDFSFTDAEVTDLVLGGSFDGESVGGGLSMEVLAMGWVGFGAVASFTADRQP